MEETLTKEEPELECKTSDETQGGTGIRRRLRDRDLLKKRKAEAEEKETDQVESRRKRARREGGSSSGRRGRPRKTEPEILVIPEEPAPGPEAPVGVVDVDVYDPDPEPVEAVPTQTFPSLTPLLPVESQPAYDPDSPILVPVDPPVPTAVVTLSSAALPAPAREEEGAALAPDAVQTPVSAQIPAPIPSPFRNTSPSTPIAESPNMALSETSILAPSQAESVYIESTDREILDQVLIEDLGPDEQEDLSSSQKNVGEQCTAVVFQ